MNEINVMKNLYSKQLSLKFINDNDLTLDLDEKAEMKNKF